ncbi:MAG: hypothetical protein IKE31_07105, partial [Eubacterium sp.]|nr:hypothetical protein [Eubacterium sp.]
MQSKDWIKKSICCQEHKISMLSSKGRGSFFLLPYDSMNVNFPIILRLMTSDNWLTRDKGAVTGDRVKNRNPVGDTAPFIFEREYLDKKLMKYKKSCEDQGIRMN